MDISNRPTPVGLMRNDGAAKWSDNMLNKSITVIFRNGNIDRGLTTEHYRWDLENDDSDIIFFTTYKKEHNGKEFEWFWRDDEVKVAEPNEFDFGGKIQDEVHVNIKESNSEIEFSKNPYYTNDGEDYLDDFIKNHSPTEVRAAFKFTIGKYLSRLGKKDGIVEESYKIADYAQRFHNFELSLLNDD